MDKYFRKTSSYLELNTVLNLKRKQIRRIRCRNHIVYPDFHVMYVERTGLKDDRESYYKYLKKITKNGKEHCTLKEFNKEFGMVLTLPALYVRKRPYNSEYFKKDDIFMTWNKNGRFYRNDKVPSTLCKKYFPNPEEYEFDEKILLNLPAFIMYSFDDDYSLSYYENSFLQNTDKLFNKKYGCFLTLPAGIKYCKEEDHYSYQLNYYLQDYQHRTECNPITGELLPAFEVFNSSILDDEVRPYYPKNICYIYGINVSEMFYKSRYSDEYVKKDIRFIYQQNNYPNDEKLFLNFEIFLSIDKEGKILFNYDKKKPSIIKRVRVK